MDDEPTGDTDQISVEPPPPTYDASGPPLPASTQEEGESSQQPATACLDEVRQLPLWLRLTLLVLTVGPLIAPIVIIAFVGITRRDPLVFSVLSLLLIVSLVYTVVFAFVIVAIIGYVMERIYKTLGIPLPTPNKSIPATARKRAAQLMLAMTPFTVGPFMIYLVFWGTCISWGTTNGFVHLSEAMQVVHDFQAKVSVQDAVVLLAKCLQDRLPSRNATVEDFSACLTAIGVKERVGG